MWIAVAVTVVATVFLVAGHALGRERWTWVAKPVASAGFVALGLLRMDPASTVDRWLVAALVLGWIGDQLLIPKRTFLAGLGAFLLGHLAYLPGFAHAAPLTGWPWAPALPLGAFAVGAAIWLWPHLGRMRLPVIVYLTAVAAMAFGAWGATLGGPMPWRCGVGGTLFMLSDLTVARGRFVRQDVLNPALGLPAYYAGQLLLASCVGLV